MYIRVLIVGLTIILFSLWYRLFLSYDSGFLLVNELERRLESAVSKNLILEKANTARKDVIKFAKGEEQYAVMEEKARIDLSLIRSGEIFYLLVEE